MIFKPLVILKSRLNSSSSFRFLIATVLALGLFFRFANLDQKIYWYDEAFTSLRISGYTEEEVAQQVFNGNEINVSDLQKFQHPNSEKKLIDTVKGLALEEPQIPPLYFVILRFWVELFGDSVAATRSLSAVISLLAFPCIYWLCQELFKSPLVGWMAVLLVAISPFHVLYAQEARMYSLWTVTTLLSSASLLRAMRLKTKMGWAIYTVTLALSFYSFLLSLPTAIGHGIYVFFAERFKFTKTVTSYLLASLGGLLLFLPWIWIILNRLPQIKNRTDWTGKHSFFSIVRSWAFKSSHIFFDLDVNDNSSRLSILLERAVAIVLLVLVVYSIYFLYKTQKRAYFFVLPLIIVLPVIIVLRDLLSGDLLSGQARNTLTTLRYLVPSYLGVQIAVAHLLSRKITDISVSIPGRTFWHSVTTTLLLCGIISCAIISQSASKDNDKNFQIAQTINQSIQPLVVSSGSIGNASSVVGNMLSLSHLLDPKVKLKLTIEPEIPSISSDPSDIFLYQPSTSILRRFEKEYKIESANSGDDVWLWRLKPRQH
jgi:uncharacterized membrane protein